MSPWASFLPLITVLFAINHNLWFHLQVTDISIIHLHYLDYNSLDSQILRIIVCFVPTFEEDRMIMLSVSFLFSQLSAIGMNTNFQQNIFDPIEDVGSWNQI